MTTPANMLLEQQKREKLRLLEEKQRLRDGLPYLYARKKYKWSQEFFTSTNRMCLLTAANQIGKSTIQIERVIDWATNPAKWAQLWGRRPGQFWYLYPTKDVATAEFETKWMPMLPQGAFKTDPKYGWEEQYDNKKIVALRFFAGNPEQPIVVYFKTYAQDVQYLQSGTVDYIACDEELPWELFDELKARLRASKGYFSLVFTATLGQEFWRLAMEERGKKHEKFPLAAKWQISLYDCQTFLDGTASIWTNEYIAEVIAECGTEAEVQRRVFGKFVLTEGRRYESFSVQGNCRPGGAIPHDWLIYSGIDSGGGGDGHPAAIAFLAVKPDFTAGRVVRAWRGEKGVDTTASDILMRHREMKGELHKLGLDFICCRYDWADKDMTTIAGRIGEPITPAEKGHDHGEKTLNSLFKNQMLWLDEEQPDVMKMAYEFCSLRTDTPKNKCKDDLIDTARYPSATIPWNFSILTNRARVPDTFKEPPKEKTELDRRRERFFPESEVKDEMQGEFDEWNDAYGN